MGDYVTVRPIQQRHPALGSAPRPFVLATLNVGRLLRADVLRAVEAATRAEGNNSPTVVAPSGPGEECNVKLLGIAA